MQGEVYLSNVNGVKVNPAIEENQQLIVNELAESTAKNSLDFGTEAITLGAGVAATAGDQPCRTALVIHTGTDLHVGNSANGDADATGFLIPPDVLVPIPVRNTNKLSFFSTASNTVHILWRD